MALPGIIVDLSSNNGHPIDYAAAKQAGVIGAIVKATQGTGYTNPYYTQDVDGFTAVGVPAIAYHFADFTDAAAEAAYFVSVAGSRARVLDSETNTNVAWQNAFLTALNLPGSEELDYGSASSLPRSGIRSFLWPAAYGINPGFGVCWQFTDVRSVAGMPGTVDASEWTGTQGEFAALFGLITVTPPPTPLPTNQIPQEITMGLPTGCTDQGAVRCQIRAWWNTFRDDTMTAADQGFWLTLFYRPADEPMLGIPGMAGDPDLLLAGIVDNARSTGHLRPAFSSAV